MSNYTISSNMSLVIPTVGTDPGPNWASDLNASLTLIDQHDHSNGSGVRITPSGLNINSDLTLANNNLTNARSLRLQSQSAALSGTSDLGCLYEVTNDLYFNDGLGNQVRITQNGGVAGSPGSIANLTSPASASYVSANSTFVWQSAASTPANLDAASVLLRNLSANSFAVTLAPPAAMAANFNLTLPTLPGSGTKIVQLDSTGAMSATLSVDNTTLQNSGNLLSVKAGGINTPQLAPISINASKIITNINLNGSAIQADSQDIVVSANPASGNGLMIVRGRIANSITPIQAGEGFTVTTSGAGSWTITFNTAFNDTPVITGACEGDFIFRLSGTINATTFSVITTNRGTGANGYVTFDFIAIGQRV